MTSKTEGLGRDWNVDEQIPPGYERGDDGEIVEIPELYVDFSGNKTNVELAEDTVTQTAFLNAYAKLGRVVAACAVARVTPPTVYKLCRNDADFRAKVAFAQQLYASKVLAEVQRRGVHGVTKPVFYKGEIVGTVQEYSDKLLELELRRADPEIREMLSGPRSQTTVNVNQSSVTNVLAMHGASDAGEPQAALDPRTMSQAERDAMRALLAARRATQALGSGPQAGILPGASEQASAGSGQASARSMPMLEVEATERGHAATKPAGIAPEASGLPQGGRKR